MDRMALELSTSPPQAASQPLNSNRIPDAHLVTSDQSSKPFLAIPSSSAPVTRENQVPAELPSNKIFSANQAGVGGGGAGETMVGTQWCSITSPSINNTEALACNTEPEHASPSVDNWGARWLSGRVSDSGARGRGFETYRRRVVSLSKTLYSPKVLVNYPGSDGSVPT